MILVHKRGRCALFSLLAVLISVSSAWPKDWPAGPVTYHVSPGVDYVYTKPAAFEFLTNVPKDYSVWAKETFSKENIPDFALVTAMTLALLPYDQRWYEQAQSLGRKNGISQKDNTKTFWSFKGIPIYRGPTDTGSWLYYIGDGWTHLTITAGFYGYGMLGKDLRALRTSYALLESITSVAIADQVIKHVTGRESPDGSTEAGGVWRFFPNQVKYHKHVSHYDAYPSGHLATATATLTVISANYPEYNIVVLPVGYTLMGLVIYQMMNNGVHWASDYPLGFALGYSFGKIAINNNRTVITSKTVRSPWEFRPVLYGDYLGGQFDYKF
jgi:hypothetical protein